MYAELSYPRIMKQLICNIPNKSTRRILLFISYLPLLFMLLSCNVPNTSVTFTTTTIVPLNHPPVLDEIGNKTVYQGTLLEFTIHAFDPDNDDLTYMCSNLPYGASFNPDTQIFSFTPESVTTYKNVSFSVSDGQNIVSQVISIIVLPVIPYLLTAPCEGVMPLVLIYYGDETSSTKATILDTKPQYFICNTLHSLWGEISGNGSNVVQNPSTYQAAGIKVIGYITSGYEGTQTGGSIDEKWYTLQTNFRLIKNMAEIDHVDGIFIDETSDFPNAADKDYLKQLTTLAHNYNLITWCNVGTESFDSWYLTSGGFDMINSNEDWHAQGLSEIQHNWGYRISVTGFNKSYTAQDAFNLTIDALRKNLSFCYITDDSVGYNTLPSWINDYVTLLRDYQVSPDVYPISLGSNNCSGIVASSPVPSGAPDEYNFNLQIVNTNISGLTAEQQVWCAATTDDFPYLLTVGKTLTGNLDDSFGWWVLKKGN